MKSSGLSCPTFATSSGQAIAKAKHESTRKSLNSSSENCGGSKTTPKKNSHVPRRERARKLFSHVQHNDQCIPSDLEKMILEDAEVLWVPVSCGMTCMHLIVNRWTRLQYIGDTVCTQGLRFLRPSSMEVLYSSRNLAGKACINRRNDWHWILKQATQNQRHRKMFITLRDSGGDSVLDTFWNSWSDPCKVPLLGDTNEQSHVPLYLRCFADSLNKVLDDPEKLTQVGNLVDQYEEGCEGKSFLNETSRDDVYLVTRFWLACRLVLDNASGGEGILPFLASYGSCPEGMARLSIALQPHQISQIDPEGRTLMHVWAQARKPVHAERDGMLAPLLKAYPNASLVKDNNGRLPIHHALHCGKPIHQINILWRAAPASLYVPDPIKGLNVVVLITLAARKEKMLVLRDLDRRNPSVSLHDWLDSRRDTDSVRRVLDVQVVDAAFNVLRAYPEILR